MASGALSIACLVHLLDGVLDPRRAGLRRARHARALAAGLGPLVVRVRLVNLAVLRGRGRPGLPVVVVGIRRIIFLRLVARVAGLRGDWLVVLGHERLVRVQRVSGLRHRLRDSHVREGAETERASRFEYNPKFGGYWVHPACRRANWQKLAIGPAL